MVDKGWEIEGEENYMYGRDEHHQNGEKSNGSLMPTLRPLTKKGLETIEEFLVVPTQQ